MPRISVLDMPDVPNGQLPPHIQLQKTHIFCDKNAPTHTDGVQYHGSYTSMNVHESLIDDFHNNFKVNVIRLTSDVIEFDMIGIDASLANAFRRILISELPTMAIEKVFFVNNTSVIPDEVLAHRLGLIPVDADPRLFEYISDESSSSSNEKNTIVFKLNVFCKDSDERMTVNSNQLKWLPKGSQLHLETDAKENEYTSFRCSQDSPEFSNKSLGLKHDDIIIAKLGPGQGIELEAHAVKGIGETHAKWSPVSTAWYRMLPEIVLMGEIENEMAEKLVKKCPVNVFDIEDLGAGRKKAVVSNPRSCTLCRECIRDAGWEERISLRRVKNHFIFTIESSGALPPEVLFTEAVKILEEKCEALIHELSF